MEDNQFKQRLVGAIVLVSLGVIFIPLILTGSDPAVGPGTESNIPEKPEREFVSRIIPLDHQAPEPVPDSKPPESTSQTEAAPLVSAPAAPEPVVAAEPAPASEPAPAETKPQSVATKTVEKTPAPPPVMHKTVSAWVVQMGIFESKQNAYNLRDKLRKNGFDAFVDTQHDNDTTKYRVRVGPEVKRESADALVAKLQKAVAMKGFVTKYP